MKRSAEEAELQASGVIQPGQEVPWSQVPGRQQQGQQGRNSRPVQYGTDKVTVARVDRVLTLAKLVFKLHLHLVQ